MNPLVFSIIVESRNIESQYIEKIEKIWLM